MLQKIKNVILPESWNLEYLNSFKYEIRPDWNVKNYYEDWLTIGVTCDNSKGLEWHFLEKDSYLEQKGIDQPMLETHVIEYWWLSKIMPGCMLPMHYDGPNYDNKIRAFSAVTDYTPGHIFVYKNILWSNYLRGDTYLMEDNLHGAANLTTKIKITLQLVLSEK